MITDNNKQIILTANISAQNRQDIIKFLQGAVYSWRNTKKTEWFGLKELMGGDNYYWTGTPLEFGSFGIWILMVELWFSAQSIYSIIEWNKSGFTGLIIVSLIASFLDVADMGIIKNLISCGISILIIYGVLHIHNSYNAKTTWEQLL